MLLNNSDKWGQYIANYTCLHAFRFFLGGIIIDYDNPLVESLPTNDLGRTSMIFTVHQPGKKSVDTYRRFEPSQWLAARMEFDDWPNHHESMRIVISRKGIQSTQRCITCWLRPCLKQRWHSHSWLDDYQRLAMKDNTLWFTDIYTGWWFGTCLIFHNIWVVILPIDFHIFQDG